METIHLVDAWDEQRVRKAYGWKEWDEYIANFDIADHAAVTAYVSQKLRYCDWPPEPLVSPDDFRACSVESGTALRNMCESACCQMSVSPVMLLSGWVTILTWNNVLLICLMSITRLTLTVVQCGFTR